MAVITEASDHSGEEENVDKEPATDEMLTEESQVSGEDSNEKDIDFSNLSSKDMLPDKMKAFRPPRVKGRIKQVKFEDCCCDDDDESSAGEDEYDFEDNQLVEKKKKKKKSKTTEDDQEEESKSSFAPKIIAFIVLFPMLVTGGYMLSDVVGKLKFNKQTQQVGSAVIGGIIAVVAMAKLSAYKSTLKFILCFAWIIFLVPTYQVYKCSPIELKNDMLGTWFKLKTPAGKFLEDSYSTSECLRTAYLPSPYTFSLIAPKIRLKVDISDVVNLDTENDVPEVERLSYFLLVSKRSVKKKFHKIYLMVEAPNDVAVKLRNALKLNSEEKDKNLLLLEGTLKDLDEPLEPMKKELEKMNYNVRPMKLTAYSVKYTDRYVKLKQTVDENLY